MIAAAGGTEQGKGLIYSTTCLHSALSTLTPHSAQHHPPGALANHTSPDLPETLREPSPLGGHSCLNCSVFSPINPGPTCMFQPQPRGF